MELIIFCPSFKNDRVTLKRLILGVMQRTRMPLMESRQKQSVQREVQWDQSGGTGIRTIKGEIRSDEHKYELVCENRKRIALECHECQALLDAQRPLLFWSAGNKLNNTNVHSPRTEKKVFHSDSSVYSMPFYS